MKLYRERPITIEAMQWDGTEEEAIRIAGLENFTGLIDYRQKKFFGFYINMGDKQIRVDAGDYIIQDWQGDFSVMSEKLFEKKYKILE